MPLVGLNNLIGIGVHHFLETQSKAFAMNIFCTDVYNDCYLSIYLNLIP